MEAPAALGAAARYGKVPGFLSVEDLVEYLIYVGERSAASDHLEQWLSQHEARMLPEHRETIAALIRTHELDLELPPPVDPSRSFIARLFARFRAIALANADVPANLGGIERPRVDWEADEDGSH